MKIYVLLALIAVIVGFSHWPSSVWPIAAWSRRGRTKDGAPRPDSMPA